MYSPTYSSGNHISSINHWAEASSSKNNDHSAPTPVDESSRTTAHSLDVGSDIDKNPNMNVDLTPIGQLGLQQQSFQAANISYGVSPKAGNNPLHAKHNASSFATHAMKSTPLVKTQSDKSGAKDKKQTDSNEKDQESQPARRPSIEKGIEGVQNIGQTLSQTHNITQQSVSSYTNNPHSHLQHHSLQEHGQDLKREPKYEKPANTANTLSPSEKVGPNANTIQENPQTKSHVKPFTTNLQQSNTPTSQKRINQPPVSNQNLVSGYVLPNPSHQEPAHSNVRPNAPSVLTSGQNQNQNIHQGPTCMSQPNSATFKGNPGSNPQQSSNQNTSTNVTNTRAALMQQHNVNLTLQKISISSQNSLGSVPKSNMPLAINQPIKYNKSNLAGPTGHHNQIADSQQITRSSSLKTTDMSHSTHNKLQSTELLDNVKVRSSILTLSLICCRIIE